MFVLLYHCTHLLVIKVVQLNLAITHIDSFHWKPLHFHFLIIWSIFFPLYLWQQHFKFLMRLMNVLHFKYIFLHLNLKSIIISPQWLKYPFLTCLIYVYSYLWAKFNNQAITNFTKLLVYDSLIIKLTQNLLQGIFQIFYLIN